MEAKGSGTVKEGILTIHNRPIFDRQLKAFKDCNVEITIKKVSKKRSNPQLRFYWGVCVNMVLKGLIDAGWNASEIDADITHDLLKSKFLQKEVINVTTGETILLNNSTKKLTTTEFMDYIAEIQQWAATYLNLFIPDPNEVL